nr:matrix protein [Modoc virus]
AVNIASHPEIVPLKPVTYMPTLGSVNDRVGKTEEWVTNNMVKTLLFVFIMFAIFGFDWKTVVVLCLAALALPSFA